jgi:hypothetical protein
MSKQIEDQFNLPRLEDALKAQAEANGEQRPVEAEQLPVEDTSAVESVANALQGIDPANLKQVDPLGTEDHVLETDDIYLQAMQAYKDLLDLGFNIESKHAGANAFMPAAKMLEIALKASQSKKNSKLERIKAIMEKEMHDRDMNNHSSEGVIEDDGHGSFMAYRKDLIEKIRKGEI